MKKNNDLSIHVTLDADLPVPLHSQLYQQIRTAIIAGRIQKNAKLPGSRLLASQLNISRNTVITAYDSLQDEGFLHSKPKSGLYVCELTNSGAIEAVPFRGEAAKVSNHTRSVSEDMIVASTGHIEGTPALDQFPFDVWARIQGSVWRKANAKTLVYTDVAGYKPLRHEIIQYLKATRGIVAEYSQVLILSSVQQGLRLIADSILRQTDNIFLEDPGYYGLYNAVKTAQQKTVSLPVDAEGICPPKNKQSGLLMASPARQFPLTVTMSVQRRKELLEWAEQTCSYILEDDYDNEFRYAGTPLASIQGQAGGERVFYIGSFSKSVFPALRIAYLIVPPHLMRRVTQYRKDIEGYPSIQNQLALASFMEQDYFGRHLRRLKRIHLQRLEHFQYYFDRYLGQLLHLHPSDAGLHLMATPRRGMDMDDVAVATLAKKSGIGASPLSETYFQAMPQKGLLVGFADIADEDIGPRLEVFSNKMLSFVRKHVS